MFKNLCNLFKKNKENLPDNTTDEKKDLENKNLHTSNVRLIFDVVDGNIYTTILCVEEGIDNLKTLTDLVLTEDAKIYIIELLKQNNNPFS